VTSSAVRERERPVTSRVAVGASGEFSRCWLASERASTRAGPRAGGGRARAPPGRRPRLRSSPPTVVFCTVAEGNVRLSAHVAQIVQK